MNFAWVNIYLPGSEGERAWEERCLSLPFVDGSRTFSLAVFKAGRSDTGAILTLFLIRFLVYLGRKDDLN